MTAIADSTKITVKRFYSPATVIGRFVSKRTLRVTIIWAVVFGVYVASKAIGFVDVYPTQAARIKIAETFSNNVGIEFIIGRAPHSGTTAAYVAWNTLGLMVILGAIWMLLLATKYFRGEEDNGRLELLLSGQTTPRRAAVNIFLGFLTNLSIFFVVITALFVLVGRHKGVDFNTSASLFFALAVTSGMTMFLMVGALMSQLMSTRSKATSFSLAIVGICFIFRAIADVGSYRWLLNITPLGWVEKLQPLSNSQPIWLLPILGLTLVLALFTIFFAGRRDLGSSIIAEKAEVKPHFNLLNSPLGVAFRLSRVSSISWLSTFFLSATLYGLIAKSTAQVFTQSTGAKHFLKSISHQSQVVGITGFLGAVFLIQIVLIMAYVSSAVTSIRKDEAEGYLDNFLVRPFNRMHWLMGRFLMILSVLVAAGLLTAVGIWIGVATQHGGVSFASLFSASINGTVPVLFVLGAGIFAFGLLPRLTSLFTYGVLAWSFLIETLGSGIKLKHWILDTSILNHIAFAPAVNPRWSTNVVIILISLALGLGGLILFNRRDLELE